MTGQYEGSARFGTHTLPWWGGADAFVAKYTSAGLVVWVSAAGGTGADAGSSIALDRQGNCYVAGFFEGTAIFGVEHLTAPGSRDVFLAKYGPDGVLLWLRQVHGSVSASGGRVGVDGQGDCYLAGTFRGTATFGTNPLRSASGSEDIYVAKFNPDGEAQWAVRAGGAGSGDDVFLAKYSAEGVPLWVQKAGGPSNDYGFGVRCAAASGSERRTRWTAPPPSPRKANPPAHCPIPPRSWRGEPQAPRAAFMNQRCCSTSPDVGLGDRGATR